MKLKSTLISFALLWGFATYGQMTTVDLSASDDPTALQSAVEGMTEATHVLLKSGVTYSLESPKLAYSLIVESIGDKALVKIKGGFDLAAEDTNIGQFSLVNLEIFGNDAAADYASNWSQSGTIGEIVFDNCEIHSFRGVMRWKDSKKIITGKVTVTSSIINDVGGYGIFNQDNGNAESFLGDLVFSASTVANVERIIVSKNAVGSVKMTDCTFYNTPRYGRSFIDIADATAVIEGGVLFENVILSTGLNGAPNNGVRAGVETEVTITNSYATNDFVWNSLAWRTEDAAPFLTYAGSAMELFEDVANLNFTIIDEGFVGKTSVGDPRFYAGTNVGINTSEKASVQVCVNNGKVVFNQTYDQITVYSITGQMLKSIKASSSVEFESSGLYVIKIVDAAGVISTLKIVL